LKVVGLGIPKGIAIVFFCAGAVSGCSVVTDGVPAEAGLAAPVTIAVNTVSELQVADKSFAAKSRQSALENSVSGKSVVWKNPASGARGSVTPLKTWKTKQGAYCRSFREWIRPASGKSIRRRGIACRSSNAVWKAA